MIDAKDPFTSSWVEAKIVRIARKKNNEALEYHVLFQGYIKCVSEIKSNLLVYLCFRHEREIPLPRSFKQIRPRAEKLCSNQDLKVGETVMVNYNMEETKERGLWFVVCCSSHY